MSELINVNNLTVRYGGVRAVEEVSFNVSEGKTTVLLGANGAGKSSILKAISGLVKSSGQVVFLGEDVSHLSTQKRLGKGIVYVPEGREIVTSLNVVENLILGAYNFPRSIVRQRQEMVLEFFPDLASRLKSPAGLLSGGQQQMLAIGRGMMSGPKILLLDEPSLGLAPLLVRNMFASLKNIQDETKLSILLVEQNFVVAAEVAQRIHFVRSGQISGSIDASEMATSGAREHAVETFLGGTS